MLALPRQTLLLVGRLLGIPQRGLELRQVIRICLLLGFSRGLLGGGHRIRLRRPELGHLLLAGERSEMVADNPGDQPRDGANHDQ